MRPNEFLSIVHTAEKLKDTVRHCVTSNRRPESVAEHSWRIALMSTLLRDAFPTADIAKVTEMCLIHDLGECFTGDIPVFNKTDRHREIERDMLDRWVDTLPKDTAERLRALYAEMEAQSTLESKLYKAMDKLEAVIQHNESPLDTWEDHEYALQRNYAHDTVRFSEWLTELRADILRETEEKIEKGI